MKSIRWGRALLCGPRRGAGRHRRSLPGRRSAAPARIAPAPSAGTVAVDTTGNRGSAGEAGPPLSSAAADPFGVSTVSDSSAPARTPFAPGDLHQVLTDVQSTSPDLTPMEQMAAAHRVLLEEYGQDYSGFDHDAAANDALFPAGADFRSASAGAGSGVAGAGSSRPTSPGLSLFAPSALSGAYFGASDAFGKPTAASGFSDSPFAYAGQTPAPPGATSRIGRGWGEAADADRAQAGAPDGGQTTAYSLEGAVGGPPPWQEGMAPFGWGAMDEGGKAAPKVIAEEGSRPAGEPAAEAWRTTIKKSKGSALFETIEDAKNFMKATGSDPYFSSEPNHLAAANLVLAVFHEAFDQGLIRPHEVHYASQPFRRLKKDMQKAAVAMVNEEMGPDGKLFYRMCLNPKSPYWVDPATIAANVHENKGWSTAHFLHPLRHELGHLQYMQCEKYKDFKGGVLSAEQTRTSRKTKEKISEKDIASEVSMRAEADVEEFVAEVYAGMMAGREFSAEVLSLYRQQFGGPEVSVVKEKGAK